jgi:hypothetical protein
MNIWVRVASTIRCGCETGEGIGPDGSLKLIPELNLTVYPSKDQAEGARRNLGGIILEVNAACLEGQNELGKEVILLSDESRENPAPPSASIGVCFEGLPYTMVPNYGPYEPGTVEPQGDVADFGPEAVAWFEALEKETGFEMHQ